MADRASSKSELIKALSTSLNTNTLKHVTDTLEILQHSWLTADMALLKSVDAIVDEILNPTSEVSKPNTTDEWQTVPLKNPVQKAFKRLRCKQLEITSQPTLAETSAEVCKHEMFDRAVYQPYKTRLHRATLYHGTFSDNIASFRKKGISPKKACTELSCDRAFYLINDPRAAIELPIHNHLADSGNIALYRFTLDVDVLHGETKYDGINYFKVKWFNGSTPEWKEFVANNLYNGGVRHDYDIVIAPLAWPQHGTRGVKCKGNPGADLTQIAFCSESSWTYLASCVNKLFEVKLTLPHVKE